MDKLKFECHNCNKKSKFNKPVDDGIRRGFPDKESRRLKFYCEHCGTTNELELDSKTINMVIENYFKEGGDIGGLISDFLGKW